MFSISLYEINWASLGTCHAHVCLFIPPVCPSETLKAALPVNCEAEKMLVACTFEKNLRLEKKLEDEFEFEKTFELRQAKRNLQDQIYENVFLVVSKRANHSEHFDYQVFINKQFYHLFKRK